ncbi:MAG: gluconokinase [Verrucomicrobiota bacterium]
METGERPTVIIFMGVAGSGKSTVGALFAKRTGAVFYEGDHFHPPGNVAKMSAGVPLTDADRAPWLSALREVIGSALGDGIFSVLTCSALKASYRESLTTGYPFVSFVFLTGPPALIEARLKKRRGHFMPSSLLESQLAILEPPKDALLFSCEKSPKTIVEELLHHWGLEVQDGTD